MPASSRRLPTADRARLDLTGDRVLATVALSDGRRAVATRLALFLLSDDDVRREPWCEVDRGSLEPATRALTVRWVSGVDDVLPLGGGRETVSFAQVFRERVQASVVHAVSLTVAGGWPLRVALRRDEDGALFTQVIGDESIDLTDPAVLALVEAAERDVRDAAGLSS